jgi:Mn2+/Fe2+ NRAMP family transporter
MASMRMIEQEAEVAAPRSAGIVVRRAWQRRILTFLMVFGPGLIVMEADNDAGAVSTYMQAGGQYGMHLLWLLLLLLPICYFLQEMVARLGIVTGKGHAAMIYERFGKWWGRFSFLDLLFVNFLTLITEFAAISLALSALGVRPSISVPISAIGLVLLVVTGSYLRWERIVIALCLMDLVWFILAFITHPRWSAVAYNSIVPSIPREASPAASSFWSSRSSAQPSLPGSSSSSGAASRKNVSASPTSSGRASIPSSEPSSPSSSPGR